MDEPARCPPGPGARKRRARGRPGFPGLLPARFGALRERQFRLLWTGQSVSALGDNLVRVAQAFAVLRLHGSPADIGYVLAASTASQAAFLPVGGVWADRLPRRAVMLWSDVVRAAIQAALAGLLISGLGRVGQLVIGGVAYGMAAAFFSPAATGLVPQTVSPQRLQQANALMGLPQSTFHILGPAVSGLMIAFLGPGWVFAADSVTFAVSAVFLSRLAVPSAARGRSLPFGAELAAGWHAFASRRWLWRTVANRGVWNFAFAPFFVLGPVIAQRHLGGSLAWGTIAAALGAGMVIGGVLAMHLTPARPLVAGNLALTLSGLPLLALIPPLPAPLIAAAALAGFAGMMLTNGLWFTALQHHVPAEALSRVSSLDWLICFAAMPLGLALTGPVVTAAGTRAALLGSAALLAAAAGLTAADPAVRRLHRPPQAPAAPGDHHAHGHSHHP
jgi:MFS family permease